jgi:hypothetical protein
MASTALRPGGLSGIRIWNRELATYPERDERRMHLLLVVLITVTLYYELYVGSGVATIMLAQLKIPFPIFVYILAAGNLLGAFASLLAGLADRFGRANLVVYGLLVVGLITLFWVPNVTTVLEWGLSFGVVSFVEGIILVATPALIRDFAPQVGRATAMGFWTIGKAEETDSENLHTFISQRTPMPVFKMQINIVVDVWGFSEGFDVFQKTCASVR